MENKDKPPRHVGDRETITRNILLHKYLAQIVRLESCKITHTRTRTDLLVFTLLRDLFHQNVDVFMKQICRIARKNTRIFAVIYDR